MPVLELTALAYPVWKALPPNLNIENMNIKTHNGWRYKSKE